MDRIAIVVTDSQELFVEGLCHLINHERDLKCVATAKDKAHFLQLVNQLKPDIAIVPLRMGDTYATMLCKQAKSLSPNTRILILTNRSDEQAIMASADADIDGLLFRNTSCRELMNALRMINSGDGVFDHKAIGTIMKAAAYGGKSVSRPNSLRCRELEVLRMLAAGKTNREIAEELHLSAHTVSLHVVNILRKMDVKSRTEAAAHAICSGLIDKNDVLQ